MCPNHKNPFCLYKESQSSFDGKSIHPIASISFHELLVLGRAIGAPTLGRLNQLGPLPMNPAQQLPR